MGLNDTLRDRQSQTCALALAPCDLPPYLRKFVEDCRLVRRRNAHARIRNRDLNNIALVDLLHRDGDIARRFSELDGVAEQVYQDLLDAL